jgi:glutathione synthase/RimK-type ligase-like ATP-grasp enzyme
MCIMRVLRECVLVYGLVTNEIVELVCARLEAMKRPYFLVDESYWAEPTTLSVQVDGNASHGWIARGQELLPLDQIRGVYLRVEEYRGLRRWPQIPEEQEHAAHVEARLAFLSLIHGLPCPVMNRTGASQSNHSKVYQQQLIQQHGFRVPRTLATSVPEAARAFVADCPAGAIYKSLSSIRSIVERIDDAALARLHLLANCPSQLQEYIPGMDIRVHVVGDECFTAEIETEVIDYRYAVSKGSTARMRAATLPAEVHERCLSLVRSLGLLLGGVDFRRTPEGEYVCLEVNPMPAFLWYERAAGLPISSAIARALTN